MNFFLRVAVTVAVMTMMVALTMGCGKSSQEAEKSGDTKQTADAATAQATGFSDLSASEFSISTAEQLAELARLVNGGNGFAGKTVSLINDVDISEYGKGAVFNDGKGWIPIGNSDNMFMGTFDGNGKKIHGLYINDTSLNDAGLFGSAATVKNVWVVDADITAGNSVGIVAGRIGMVSHYDGGGGIQNCYTSGTVNGKNSVGGVVGRVGAELVDRSAGGSIIDCYSASNVSGGDDIGGIVGSVIGASEVATNYFTGTVSGENNVGGIAGRLEAMPDNAAFGGRLVGIDHGNVTRCYSTGAVSGKNAVGGIAGHLEGGMVDSCYSTSAVSGNSAVGGLAGELGLVTGEQRAVICYEWDENQENCLKSNYDEGGMVASGSVVNSAALNPSVKSRGPAGRVAGKTDDGTLSNNIAFAGLKDRNGNTNRWVVKNGGAGDGADITTSEIASDPTLGGRFKVGWTTEKGKLPGLGGKAVDMPGHLRQ